MILLTILVLSGPAPAQDLTLHLTTRKTTSLVFPCGVRHVDRGSPQVLVQLLAEAPQLVLLKAAVPGWEETNLTVVTTDGSIYSFTVRYQEQPDCLVYRLPAKQGPMPATVASGLLDNPPLLRGLRQERGGIEASVGGIYIQDSTLFLQLLFTNRSTFDYAIESIRFFTRERKHPKRTAVQEREMAPQALVGNNKRVAHQATGRTVVALPRFTLSSGQYLAVEIQEAGGSRHLLLKLPPPRLLRARYLSQPSIGN